ncbi:Rho GTPase activation protein, partial [Zychaea mexicana]|uniref:Rho GTPase activation protein n=1 Tax=Zychaea mexicana TaxID=64656 RepID=UPI0022FE9B22
EGDVDLLAGEETYDAHVVSSLLKMWFRELPDNILTTDLLKKIMENVDNLPDRRERVTELGRIISLLPLANYTLLRLLCAHLIRVVQNAGANKMTVRNVGIVFSATLSIPTSVFSLLLTEFDDIFWTDDSNFD